MNKIKGVVCVVLGAASYGLLATFVKLANIRGLDTSVLTFFQYLFGFVVLSVAAYFNKIKRTTAATNRKSRSKMKLLLYGTSLGLTSSFYYLSLQYVPVSIAIILLMQAIWMGGVLEIFLEKTKPDSFKIIGSLVVLVGTFLSVDVIDNLHTLSYIGVGYGILASISYTVTLMATNKIATDLPNIIRSQYLVLGGFLVTVLFWNLRIVTHIEFDNLMLYSFGIFLALFGTIIPPILFNMGFPIVGIGIGSILAAIEIPVSIFSANILLGEDIKAIQWLGVFIILVSVVIINYRQINKKALKQ